MQTTVRDGERGGLEAVGGTRLLSHPHPIPHSPWMFWGLSMTKFPFQTTDKLTGRSLMSFPS